MRRRSFFTLIELVVVIAIMVILASLMFGAYGFVKDRIAVSRTQTGLNMIRDSILRFYDENQTWPNVFNNESLRLMLTPETAGEDADPPPGSVTDFGKRVVISAEDWSKIREFFIIEGGAGNFIVIKDRWGYPLKVRRSGSLQKAMQTSDGLTTSVSEAEACRNQSTFDLFSTGPDGVEDVSGGEVQDDVWPDI